MMTAGSLEAKLWAPTANTQSLHDSGWCVPRSVRSVDGTRGRGAL